MPLPGMAQQYLAGIGEAQRGVGTTSNAPTAAVRKRCDTADCDTADCVTASPLRGPFEAVLVARAAKQSEVHGVQLFHKACLLRRPEICECVFVVLLA